MDTERLRAGQRFHRQVQEAFIAELLGATAAPERSWRIVDGQGRVDIAVATIEPERSSIVIEIKGTDWRRIPPPRVRRNVLRHLNQLQRYLDTAIDELEAAQWDSVAGALLYPSRPIEGESLHVIEDAAAEQAIMVVWYEDVDWNPTTSNYT
jgi:hypothetical protein